MLDGSEQVRELPSSITTEQALLGAILIDNQVLDRVTELVEARHFSDPLHGHLFEIMRGLIEGGRLADAATVGAQTAELAEIAPGMPVSRYVGRLLSRATTTMYARDYAKVVREFAVRRELIRIGGDMIEAAHASETAVPAKEIIAGTEGFLYELAERGTYGKGSRPLSELLVEVTTAANDAYIAGGRKTGLKSGLIDLDKRLSGIAPGHLIILAGRPSMGKTALALNIAFRIAKAGTPVQVDSMEMSGEELTLRLLAEQAEIPANKIRDGELTAGQIEHVARTSTRIRETPIFIDDAGGLTIGKLSARARRIKRKRGIGCLVVDYLQLMAGGSSNRVADVTDITMGLKALAKELEIPVIALSQLSRKCEERADKRPLLSDLRDSGSIEQDADIVLFVYRDEYYIERDRPDDKNAAELAKWQDRLRDAAGKAEIIVAKDRHGTPGIVPVAFDGSLTRFSDLAHGGVR